jgi:hypothetical protein
VLLYDHIELPKNLFSSVPNSLFFVLLVLLPTNAFGTYVGTDHAQTIPAEVGEGKRNL